MNKEKYMKLFDENYRLNLIILILRNIAYDKEDYELYRIIKELTCCKEELLEKLADGYCN